MALREFIVAHRDELIAACREEIARTEELSPLARWVVEGLDRGALPSEGEDKGLEPSLDETQLIGSSAALTRARSMLGQLSRRSRVPVLVTGDFGTGKRHFARALHTATYAEGELVELDAMTNPLLLERKIGTLSQRATAFASAGVTIYAHELSELPAALQTVLARLLPQQMLPFRVIASSSRPLTQATREGLVRQDLAFAFTNVIELPALRERGDDLAELARHFAAVVARETGVAATTFSDSAMARLRDYDWPGNLLELMNIVRQVSLNTGPCTAEAADIPELGERRSGERRSGVTFRLPRGGIDFADLERELIQQALSQSGSNQTQAAQLLGLSRDQLRYRMAKFELVTVPVAGDRRVGRR